MGVVLMVAIVVVMSAVSVVVIFSAQEKAEPAPNAVLSLDSEDDAFVHQFRHESGELIAGEKIELQGVANPDTLNGQTFTQGDTVELLPT